MKNLVVLLLFVVNWTAAAPFSGEADLVAALPGLGAKLAYRHFSGYLSSTNGSHLHYWLFESQTGHPEKDPVVLWLNGGPGCSSMLGALSEIGPIHLSRNGSLSLNPYAWNQKVNLLFLESPVGVGFSYQEDGLAPIHQDDISTAHLNLEALRSFYTKFPHFADTGFYIAGESYAGIYIPTLSTLALEQKFPKNLRGVALGNPLLDSALNGNSMLHYFHYHGLMDAATWQRLVSACCKDVAHGDVRHCDMVNSHEPTCVTARNAASLRARAAAVNHYNIYADCLHDPSHDPTTPKPTTAHPSSDEDEPSRSKDSVSYDVIADRLIMESLHLTPEQYYASGPPAHTPPCLSQDYLAQYLNKADVKTALHIDPKSWDWGPCRSNIGYRREVTSVATQIKHMVDSGVTVLVYSGDVDSVCNFLGAQWFVEQLGYKVRIDYHTWPYEGQVAGFTTFYDKQLTFMTVRGAGHMVPEDRPAQALNMFNNFLGIH